MVHSADGVGYCNAADTETQGLGASWELACVVRLLRSSCIDVWQLFLRLLQCPDIVPGV